SRLVQFNQTLTSTESAQETKDGNEALESPFKCRVFSHLPVASYFRGNGVHFFSPPVILATFRRWPGFTSGVGRLWPAREKPTSGRKPGQLYAVAWAPIRELP